MTALTAELERRPGETNESLSRRVAAAAAQSVVDVGMDGSTLFLLGAEPFSRPPSAIRQHKGFWRSSAAPNDVGGVRLAEVNFGDARQDRWAGALQVDPDATVAALEFLFLTTSALVVLGARGRQYDAELNRLLAAAFDNDEGRGVNWSAVVQEGLESDLQIGRAFGEFDDRSFGIEFFHSVPSG